MLRLLGRMKEKGDRMHKCEEEMEEDRTNDD